MTSDEWAALAGVPEWTITSVLVDLLEERAAIMAEGNGWTQEEAEKVVAALYFS